MKASVVVVTYRRMDQLQEIMLAWGKETDDLWLCDCSKDGIPFDHSAFNYVKFNPDQGNRVRHAVATLTAGDIVIKADDDIIPKEGLAKDFLHWHKELGDAIMGIHGRTFEGVDYYRNTTMYAAHKNDKPIKVDFVGVITCTPRCFLAMDLYGCESSIEDLFWQNKCYPGIPKYVVPTTNYIQFSSSRDPERLCANKEARSTRRLFYKKYFERYYQ